VLDFVYLKHIFILVKFQVLTAPNIKTADFWDVAPCSLVDIYGRFRDAYCLSHQGDRPVANVSVTFVAVIDSLHRNCVGYCQLFEV
jgi:hypothetical protein